MTGNTMTTRNGRKFGLRASLAGALLTLPGLALADVNDGVAAWERGDYETAVAEWRGPAGQGDADAQFNLGQAYRLGRGVEQNTRQAEVYYAKAAAQGHLKAAGLVDCQFALLSKGNAKIGVAVASRPES